MLRKTISIDEQLFSQLKEEGILDHFKNFSDLVSNSLQKTIVIMQKENYRKQIEAMANDPIVLDDIEEIQEDFKFADSEDNAL
ncbi:MAG: Unknown protein [uncultured Sulfurovum sp.]|uniref:CopG family transcriptional regulator n=1 Tax=uncultured Sulfurovum sp. TaxID=269237 RepID=A0A6S6SE63_9BACT|nr:MAG: Unknown protein [uncultured Sulfurovum sp.]